MTDRWYRRDVKKDDSEFLVFLRTLAMEFDHAARPDRSMCLDYVWRPDFQGKLLPS